MTGSISVDLGAEVFSTRFSPDDTLVAASTYNGKVVVINALSGNVEQELGTGSTLPVMCVRWRPAAAQVKRRLILVTARGHAEKGQVFGEGAINHWHLQTQRCLHEIQENGSQTYSLDYALDGTIFASAGLDRVIRVYDEATKRCVQQLTDGDIDAGTAGHTNRVFAVKFDPTAPHLVASAGWDQTMQIWDLRKGNAVRCVGGINVCGDGVDFSPDGKQILTASHRGKDSLQIWDAGSAQLIRSYTWHGPGGSDAPAGCSIFCGRVSPAGGFAAGGVGGGEARVYDFDGNVKHSVPVGDHCVHSVDFSSDGKKLAVGDAEGKLQIVTL
jgi:WD40 repeat protein